MIMEKQNFSENDIQSVIEDQEPIAQVKLNETPSPSSTSLAEPTFYDQAGKNLSTLAEKLTNMMEAMEIDSAADRAGNYENTVRIKLYKAQLNEIKREDKEWVGKLAIVYVARFVDKCNNDPNFPIYQHSPQFADGVTWVISCLQVYAPSCFFLLTAELKQEGIASTYNKEIDRFHNFPSEPYYKKDYLVYTFLFTGAENIKSACQQIIRLEDSEIGESLQT